MKNIFILAMSFAALSGNGALETGAFPVAHYNAQCDVSALRIGQIMVGNEGDLGYLITNIAAIYTKQAPDPAVRLGPVAYLYHTKNDAVFLSPQSAGAFFNLPDGGVVPLKAMWQAVLDSPKTSLAPYEKSAQPLIVHRCFANPWDGRYPRTSH